MFRAGLAFISFGVVAFVLFTPAHISGKIALGVMSIIFILVGGLFVWVWTQEFKDDE